MLTSSIAGRLVTSLCFAFSRIRHKRIGKRVAQLCGRQHRDEYQPDNAQIASRLGRRSDRSHVARLIRRSDSSYAGHESDDDRSGDPKKWVHKVQAVPHALLNDSAKLLIEFYKEHIRRDVNDGKVGPGDFWLILRGFSIAAMQTYAGICLLVSKKRPKPLMQAAVLNRALFENLATVLSLTESPAERTPILIRDSIKLLASTYKRYTARFGEDPKWKEYLDVYRHNLLTMLQGQGLPLEILANPQIITDEWPTPGVMLWGSKKKKLNLEGARNDTPTAPRRRRAVAQRPTATNTSVPDGLPSWRATGRGVRMRFFGSSPVKSRAARRSHARPT